MLRQLSAPLLLLVLALAPPAVALPPLPVMLDALDAATPLDSDDLTLMASPKARAAVEAGDAALREGRPVAAAGHYARARVLVAAAGDAMLGVLAELDSNLVALYLDMRRGETVVSMARTLQEARSQASAPARAEAGRLLARALLAEGDAGAGLAAAQDALALCEAQEDWGADHVETLRSRLLVALAQLVVEHDVEAGNEVLDTVDALERTLGETSVEYVQLLPAAAYVKLLLQKIELARELLAQAIRGQEAALGDTNPQLEAGLWLRADAAELELGYREANTDRTRIHALMAAAFGPEHPRSLEAQVALGNQSLERGVLEEARRHGAMVAAVAGPYQSAGGCLLAAALLDLDRPREARKAATEARSRATRRPDAARAGALLALARARTGGPYAKARREALEASETLAKHRGARTRAVGRLELVQAQVELAAGTYGGAVRLVKEAASLFEGAVPPMDRRAFLVTEARARWRRGKADAAEKSLQELQALSAPLDREAPLARAREKVLAAEVALARGESDEARKRFTAAKAAVARLPEGALARHEFLGFQARVALANEQWSAAEAMCHRWIGAIAGAGGEKDPRLADANLVLADAYRGQGDLSQALDAARRVQGMGRRTPDGLTPYKKGAARRVAQLTRALAAQGVDTSGPPGGPSGAPEEPEAP